MSDKEVREKAVALVRQIDAILASDSWKGVFTTAHVHGYNYTGPQIGAQLEDLRKALNDSAGGLAE